jgi:hypothetical protein
MHEAKTTADEAQAPESQNLIFGRFGSLEEAQAAYEENAQALTRLKGLEQTLGEAQLRLLEYEKDATARESGYQNRFDMALQFEAKQKELDDYVVAGSYLLPPDRNKALQQEVQRCRQAGASADLSRIRGLFTPEIVALVSEDAALFKWTRQHQYEHMYAEEKSARYKRQIEAFQAEDPTWTESDFNGNLVQQAVELSDGRIDLKALRQVIEQIEHNAVERYCETIRRQKENEEAQADLSSFSPTRQNPQNQQKWLSLEEYSHLTPEQEAVNYEFIAEQINKENRGELPRMLTHR